MPISWHFPCDLPEAPRLFSYLSARPVGVAFLIARGEGDWLSGFSTGNSPGLENGSCDCTILTGKDTVSMSRHKANERLTTYIQVLQKVMKSHQKYPKSLTTMQKTATAWICSKW